MGTSPIKNIIFDLGNVLVPLDWESMERNVGKLEHCTRSFHQTSIAGMMSLSPCKEFEAGEINEEEFLAQIAKFWFHSTEAFSREDFILAWNSLFNHIPKENLQLLSKLKNKYRLFLLSNTNSIHIKEFERILSTHGESIQSLFEEAFYSFALRCIKPERKIYQIVLDKANLIADETCFIDDIEKNVITASELGIHAVVKDPSQPLWKDLAKLRI